MSSGEKVLQQPAHLIRLLPEGRFGLRLHVIVCASARPAPAGGAIRIKASCYRSCVSPTGDNGNCRSCPRVLNDGIWSDRRTLYCRGEHRSSAPRRCPTGGNGNDRSAAVFLMTAFGRTGAPFIVGASIARPLLTQNRYAPLLMRVAFRQPPDVIPQ